MSFRNVDPAPPSAAGAIAAICAHAGGPLDEGTLEGDVVRCPWHGSRFEVATGRRRRGPTVYDQPTYEVRPAEAGGYEARRVS